MEHKNAALAPAVMEIINQVSGTYSTPFWDGLLAVTESLDTVRAVKDAIDALHGEKKDSEAYRLILALYDTGVGTEYGDKLLTLSTCEYSRTNGRMVVLAKLITSEAGGNA